MDHSLQTLKAVYGNAFNAADYADVKLEDLVDRLADAQHQTEAAALIGHDPIHIMKSTAQELREALVR
jgi:hypothetical protein